MERRARRRGRKTLAAPVRRVLRRCRPPPPAPVNAGALRFSGCRAARTRRPDRRARARRAGARTRRACRPGSRDPRPGRPAARGRRRASSSRCRAAAAGGCQRLHPLGQLGVADVEMDAPVRHVELDEVAGAHGRERAAVGRFRRGVEDDRAVRGAAHARVADADHVGDALPQHLRRQRHVADLGHAGVALRAAVAQHHHAGLVDVEALVVDPGVELLDRVEHDGAAAVLHQRRRRRARLDDRAARREVAAQDGDAGVRLERRVERLDDVGVEVLGALDVRADRACRWR